MNKKQILVVLGPTAVGKTKLGIFLAKEFNGEIISADSLQVYRALDIGTAKATVEEQKQAHHHLIDILEISENYSVFDFQQQARKIVAKLTTQGKLPIVVGGTGLYIQALLEDFSLGGEIKDSTIREENERLLKEKGPKILWQKLFKKDPKTAEKIPVQNSRRVLRALEVFENTGQSIVDFDKEKSSLYDSFLLGLNTNRTILYDRINQRVDLMVQAGLIKETEKLFDYGKSQAAQGIGYKELFPYFKGEITQDLAIAKIKQNSRHFAKRQLTWFNNRFNNIHWYDLVQNPQSYGKIITDIENWLNLN